MVAINQADMAMKGRNWDYKKNEPDEQLKEFLDNKAASVRDRIYEATGLRVEPIYYSAGYMEDGGVQNRPYNLSKLLYYIVKATPSEKRAVYVNNVNNDEAMWVDNDEILDYGSETRKSMFDSIKDGVSDGADIGGDIGSIFGNTGRVIGTVVGGIVGGVVGAVKAVGSFVGSLFGL